jgi:hypothetical protein
VLTFSSNYFIISSARRLREMRGREEERRGEGREKEKRR